MLLNGPLTLKKGTFVFVLVEYMMMFR